MTNEITEVELVKDIKYKKLYICTFYKKKKDGDYLSGLIHLGDYTYFENYPSPEEIANALHIARIKHKADAFAIRECFMLVDDNERKEETEDDSRRNDDGR